jgi:hypothetical protein
MMLVFNGVSLEEGTLVSNIIGKESKINILCEVLSTSIEHSH